MDRRDLADLLVFETVAEAGSFTRAAARLGRAQSGLSHTVAELEARLGVALLARTTRSVRLTEDGQRLLDQVSPALRQISSGLDQVKSGCDEVTGKVRLSMTEDAAVRILVPVLPEFLKAHPAVKVDIRVDDRLSDVVAEGFDAGIRYGSHLEMDMIALPLGQDLKAVIVGSPVYFAKRGHPKSLKNLSEHECINIRTQSHDDVFLWRFRSGDRTIDLPVPGRVLVNGTQTILSAALAGLGLAYTFAPLVSEYISTGRLDCCLDEFCPTWPGYHLYYPSRRQKSKALDALISHLRSNLQNAPPIHG